MEKIDVSAVGHSAKKKRTPIQRRMLGISDWLRIELKKNAKTGRYMPMAIMASKDTWMTIRRALNKASKP